jgi:hypothetical protein
MSGLNQSLIGGHDPKIFVEEIETGFECHICFHVLNDPRQCINGHCFCLTCAQTRMEKSSKCSVCSVTFTLDNKNKVVRDMVEERQTYCPSHSVVPEIPPECKWTGLLNLRDAHFEQDCEFKWVSCPNECGAAEFQRRHTNHHLSEDCVYRSMFCKYCGDEVIALSWNEHAASCFQVSTTSSSTSKKKSNSGNGNKTKPTNKQKIQKTSNLPNLTSSSNTKEPVMIDLTGDVEEF